MASSLRGLCSSMLLPLLLLLGGTAQAAPSSRSSLAEALEARGMRADDHHWVDTWTSMPQLVEQYNMPPNEFRTDGATFKDATVRQTLHMSVGAKRIRLQLSNTFGGSDLPITAASLARPAGGKAGSNEIDASSLAGLTFDGGKAAVTIPKGAVAYSDPIDYAVAEQSELTVTLYLADGQGSSSITGHPGSRTTTWMQAGSHVNATTVAGASVAHWYYVNAVEAWAPADTGALIVLGDSITDGRGSTTDGNNRWPDLLFARMYKNGITHIAMDNEAAGGNCVLTGGLGPPLMQRYKRDCLQQAGVRYVILFEGVNDIGGGANAAGLIAAFKTVIADCKAANLTIWGATITPFGGNGYDVGNHESVRASVNDWIRTSGAYDHVLDFDKWLADPADTRRLLPAYDSGDHLHPNPAGYEHLADMFPLDLFKK